MLSEEQIKEILVKQRETIFNKKYGIERTILRKIESKIKLPHVVVLTGLRRSGKSTLLRQLIKKIYNDEDFYYINFEDERLFNFPANEFNKLYEGLISLYGKKKVFFLDEIQNVTNFETFIRRFYEEGFKFFITGSSATLLSKELGTKLTGRHVDIVVRPFSFSEFLELREFNIEKDSVYKTESKVEIKKYFEEYLIGGGMPEYLIYNDFELLTKVYEDTILKDIAVRHKVNNIIVLRNLYSILISNFANKFSFNSLKKITDINSVNTIKKFIHYLEETYFARTINKFDYSLKKQLINDKKFYVIDNGFIGVLSKKLTKDKGWLLENLVFNSLNKNNDVFYYSNKNECDFLLVKNKTVINAIQVCYDLNEDNREREISGLSEAMDKFKLNEGLLLTNSQEEEIKIESKKIKVMPVWKWLLEEK
ncbi:ATP-binding protein [Candidatus Pacearchaeota archaeon]|nr:ATP-binding protein [Candidatus Pacearchaeota archaeon]